MTPEPTDWRRLMQLGLGVLRLTPEAFWTMTPLEFQRALEGAGVLSVGPQRAMGRAGLDELMARFPDKTECEAR